MTYESLGPESIDQLQHFADHANWSGLHPLDWERFFDFIVGTRTRGEHALPSEIEAYLLNVGGNEKIAKRVASFYEPARHLLGYSAE